MGLRLPEPSSEARRHAIARWASACFALTSVLPGEHCTAHSVVQDGTIGATFHRTCCSWPSSVHGTCGSWSWCILMSTLKDCRSGPKGMEVTILLGSKSDMPVAEKCTKVLDMFEVTYQLRVASAHRSPAFVESIIKDAEADGCKVFIAMAGLAAALPGAVAALTTKPVIGVPCGGRVPFDSLLSIVQLPPGVPAATVGVDRGDNAGYLATQILAIANPAHAARLAQNKLDQVEAVMAMDREVNGGA
jgi:5-(carboxyamino)imidazole ribonucleotide mutase